MIWFAAATAVFGFFTRPAWVTLTLAGLATATLGGIGPAWIGPSAFGLDDDKIGPRLVIAAGLLAWSARNDSWRMAVAAVAFGGLSVFTDHTFAPALVLFGAAALAAGPRRTPSASAASCS